MSNLREAVAATALANLGWDENRERAIDRVAACGRAPSLGLNIWKAKYLLESAAYDSALAELTKWYCELYKGEQSWLAKKVCDQVLYEFIFSFCTACGGAGEVVVDDLRVTCDTCKGSRIKRHSNKERCQRMQISYAMTKALNRKMQRTMGYVFDEDGIVNGILNDELERP